MSGAGEPVVLTDLGYTAEHEWARSDGEVLTVGITGCAMSARGDVVSLERSSPGTAVHDGERCGEVESKKSVSDLYSPALGTGVEVHTAVIGAPELLNQEPYGRGWLFTVGPDEPPTLFSPARYREICEGQGWALLPVSTRRSRPSIPRSPRSSRRRAPASVRPSR